MRSIPFAALLLALVLAGCGSQQQTTATAIPPTNVPPTNPVVGQGDNALATLAATVGAAQPGTLVIPQDNTQAPNAPTPAPFSINNVIFTQTGGIAHISLSIELDADGTLIRDGKTTKVSPDDVKKIETLLEGIHFFNLQGIFVSPSGTSDAYLYSLSVDAKNGSRTITSQDGMTPPELAQIYDALRALNNGVAS